MRLRAVTSPPQKNLEVKEIMKIAVNGKVIAEVMTNRSLTLAEAMYFAGYDFDSQEDMERGYINNIEGFYLDDEGNYSFDFEAAEMIY